MNKGYYDFLSDDSDFFISELHNIKSQLCIIKFEFRDINSQVCVIMSEL